MAKKELKRIAKAELQDLSRELQELALEKEGCFYRYRPKDYAGTNIIDDLAKKFTRDGDRFLFSDDLPESGTLSVCQGLLAVISAVEKLDAPLKTSNEMIEKLTDQLFESVKSEDGKGYTIAATPCVRDSRYFQKHVYIDSATWIISTVLGIVRLHITGKISLSDERRAQLVDLYRYSLTAVNNAYISTDTGKRKFSRGWNFTDSCEQPSIYFTFAVSEILIDILATFENVIRTADIALVQAEIVNALDSDGLFASEKYLEYKDQIEKKLGEEADKSNSDWNAALSGFRFFSDDEKAVIIEIFQKCRAIEAECSKHRERISLASPEIQREIEFFSLLNNGLAPYDEESPYRILEDNCKESARNIWALTKDRLAASFFSSDLTTTISEEAIEASVSSDAVFNVIMAINVLINAGIDEDAEDKINYFTFNGTEAYDTALLEYDDMRDTLRLAYDNCYQFLRRLQKQSKEYKINEYTLSFDEAFVTHEKMVKDLRKAHIRVFSLMPLMVRTKTTMGEFLVRYPQYDMIIFLEHILKHRYWDATEEKYLWIWENDSYSASGNYYFISALASFYDYYEEYENAFLKNATNNQVAKKKIEEGYHKALVESGKAADKDIAEFKEQKDTIRRLQKQIEDLEEQVAGYRNDPLRSALAGFVSGVIRETIIDILADRLGAEAERIIGSTKDSVERRAADLGADKINLGDWEKAPQRERSDFEKSMGGILSALLFEHMGEAIYSTYLTGEERTKELNQTEKNLKRMETDLRHAARYYLRGIATNTHMSDFVANAGESTLPNGMHRFLMQLIEEKQKNKGERN